VDEFKDVSKEVRGLHIVLEAIKDHWKENDLSARHKQDLDVLAEECRDTLRELESIIENHKSLGLERKHLSDRVKWAGKNLDPVRTKLINRAILLSMFHSTVTQVSLIFILQLLLSN
jgi:hypothetical protein